MRQTRSYFHYDGGIRLELDWSEFCASFHFIENPHRILESLTA